MVYLQEEMKAAFAKEEGLLTEEEPAPVVEAAPVTVSSTPAPSSAIVPRSAAVIMNEMKDIKGTFEILYQQVIQAS